MELRKGDAMLGHGRVSIARGDFFFDISEDALVWQSLAVATLGLRSFFEKGGRAASLSYHISTSINYER